MKTAQLQAGYLRTDSSHFHLTMVDFYTKMVIGI